ncbi:hypothetical protein WME73_18615 [Sorangium sp. So ce302]|uniref:hypothetical protein n=1 Tax=unclassified Sorangium TaxID=2621164 RepID=UPI003F5D92CA
MSLFSKMVLPLTLLGAAAVLGGCVGEASLEGDDEQENQPDAAEAADPGSAESIDPDAAEAVGTAQQAVWVSKTAWNCHYLGSRKVGAVGIWWGHNYWDADWACNSWIPECANQCRAVYDYSYAEWEN